MPISRPTGAGGTYAASAEATLRQRVSLTLDAVTNSDFVLTEGMPHLAFWMRQTVGALGCTAIPQFSIRQVTGVGAPTDEWLDLTAPIVLVPGLPGTPTLLVFRFPAKKIRVALQRPAGQATTVELALGCSL